MIKIRLVSSGNNELLSVWGLSHRYLLTFNRYAYVTNNPETIVDSNGHYVNECVNSPNCPSTDSGGGGTYSNNPPQSQSQSSSRPFCTLKVCYMMLSGGGVGGTSEAPSYLNWLFSMNGDLLQTAGWIVGLLASILSAGLNEITDQLIAILASSTIIANLAPDIINVFAAKSGATEVAAIGTLMIDAFNSIIMNAGFWLSLKFWGIIGAQGVADIFTGGAAQAASAIIGATNDIADTALFFTTSSTEYNSLYGS